MFLVEDEVLESAVDRILRSDELRGSEVLRRLLKFLANKSLSGEADQLKEYTVAIDGLGKPPSYDPRHNSAVRIQVGRLRHKLGEYYRGEGKDDEVVLDLPKGHFKLTCIQRNMTQGSSSSPPQAPAFDLPRNFDPPKFRPMWILIWVGLAIAIALGVNAYLRTPAKAASLGSNWTSDFQQLWGAEVNSNRPLILAIEDPLFVEMESEPGIYYRDKSLNEWGNLADSRAVAALRSTLKSSDVEPSRYYTAYGEVQVSFLLGKLLGPRVRNFSVVKTSELSWQQLSDNNVIFVGVQNIFFDKQLLQMPLAPQLVPFMGGVHNVHPKPGEPEVFLDQYATAPAEDGVAYALVTRVPGPLGSTDVESFTSSRSAGYVGAVQWFSDPKLAQVLVAHLKGKSKQMPRYYQVLLKVKFSDDVPTQTSYVLSRILH